MSCNPIAEVSAAELDAACELFIHELQARIEQYEERAAIQAEALDEGKTTTERAIDALQRLERFAGEAVSDSMPRDLLSATLPERVNRVLGRQ